MLRCDAARDFGSAERFLLTHWLTPSWFADLPPDRALVRSCICITEVRPITLRSAIRGQDYLGFSSERRSAKYAVTRVSAEIFEGENPRWITPGERGNAQLGVELL
jgi:hypothetical protein